MHHVLRSADRIKPGPAIPAVIVLSGVALRRRGAAGHARRVRAAQPPQEKEKLPPKQEVTLVTEDEVQLKATFWPGTEGKENVPVILLHAFRGSRQDFNVLAEFLQGKGCAVIAPDLRGHGDSTLVRDGHRPLAAAICCRPRSSA